MKRWESCTEFDLKQNDATRRVKLTVYTKVSRKGRSISPDNLRAGWKVRVTGKVLADDACREHSEEGEQRRRPAGGQPEGTRRSGRSALLVLGADVPASPSSNRLAEHPGPACVAPEILPGPDPYSSSLTHRRRDASVSRGHDLSRSWDTIQNSLTNFGHVPCERIVYPDETDLARGLPLNPDCVLREADTTLTRNQPSPSRHSRLSKILSLSKTLSTAEWVEWVENLTAVSSFRTNQTDR